jgi:TIR domain
MIAISYRREDSTPVAGRLHDRLQADFGRGNVFMDFDSIPYGLDFREQIRQTLKRARVVVAVIGPTWLGARGKGNRRIDDPADFVRLEIAIALQRGIPIIPVLIDDTPMPQVDNLPDDLRGLAFRNALILNTGVDFHHHADRLIAGIRELMKDPLNADTIRPGKIEPGQGKSVEPAVATKKEAQKIPSSVVDPERRKELIGGSVLIAMLIAIAGWYFFTKAGRPKNPPVLPLTIATPIPVPAETPVITPTATATAMLTPTATPLAAATPIPVLVPTPPPPPPQPDNSITDDEVQAFVAAHYRATEQKDLNYLLSQYDDLVDYNTDGRRDKTFIGNGYLNYFKRWPIASFTLGPVRVVRSPGQNTVTAYFEIRYLVRDIASNRSKQGRADEMLTISKPFGALKIISERETVHGEAPERRQGRRY